MSDPYSFPDEEPIPYSPAADRELFQLDLEFVTSDYDQELGAEPRSAFEDSNSEYGSDEDSHFDRTRRHIRKSAGASTSAFGKKIRALKSSISLAHSKSRTSMASESSLALHPYPSHVSATASPRRAPSPLASPLYTASPRQDPSATMSSLSRTTTASHSASSSLDSANIGYQSSTTSVSQDDPRSPPSLPLPPLPPQKKTSADAPPLVHHDTALIFAHHLGSQEFDPYKEETVEVDGSMYRMTAVDPDTSMAQLESSLEKLKTHRPPTRPPSLQASQKQASPGKQLPPVPLIPRLPRSPEKVEQPLRMDVELHQSSAPMEKLGSTHISEWRFPPQSSAQSPPSSTTSAGPPRTVHDSKSPLNLLPLFDFEQRPAVSSMSPAESRSSKQIRQSRTLRRTSSLLNTNDIRQALGTVNKITTSTTSPGTAISRAAASEDSHSPYHTPSSFSSFKPSSTRQPSMTSPPNRVVPFINRPVRNDVIPDKGPYVPIVLRGPPPELLNSRSRRPSFIAPLARMRTMSRSSGIPVAEGGATDEVSSKGSRPRRFWERVSLLPEKRHRTRSSVAAVSLEHPRV
ncbi:hypothetical protein EIP91_011692 [Steccherinum ochraceum]|uniref:Uncharacterized protein n=1 Tax=Steccherinum ochraceum TaxID=92696 RepID=A0A4R0S3E7_9APHY|nr:hypothetical protein EIP91_011692 [Steccherinum ochraceum]